MSEAVRKRLRDFFSQPGTLSGLLDELPIGVAVLDKHGTIMHVNGAYESITGVDRKKVSGMSCLHVLRCDFCTKGCPVYLKDDDFQLQQVDADIIDRERKRRPIKLTVSPVTDDAGEQVGVVETVTPAGRLNDYADPETGPYGFGSLVGRSPQMAKVFRMVPSVAQTDSSVLITGETGTGKDALAEQMHRASDRADGPFVKVNCGALPDTLLESELFGHAKGAFTGADQNKPGRFRMAHGGTLFLTELGDLPLNLQVKLLSFLDDKIIHPLGSNKEFHADVRVIVATHRNLEQMVAEGRFRQDLLYRLNVIRLHLPPLRERGEDIFLLQDHFLTEFCTRFNKRIEGFTDEAMVMLKNYAYPGNVRELRNLIEYAVNFCDDTVIDVRHLPAYLVHAPAPPRAAAPAAVEEAAPAPVAEVPVSGKENWEDVERRMILDALVKARGRRQAAARLLGWGRSTLWRKMKQYEIE
ncbi:sigma-54 interaction domain-containing protein [Salidesulfovibrio onnuriiensis]|uniref:sigma-54 interaction domain-containing protein n=1 Tax=Salidesulfovibrio onnuriiensis TaxID=2583823 RepID=UPI0011C9B54B|nr:sigma 54-interacting transcriptional regulator [Salidesulfovibrio onnuriiensis]